MSVTLNKSATKHGILPVTGHCYACGNRLPRGHGHSPRRWYCNLSCQFQKPPKMALAEISWGRPVEEVALEHLNAGRSAVSLAAMLGVHLPALYAWLRRLGIRKRVVWERQKDRSMPRQPQGGP